MNGKVELCSSRDGVHGKRLTYKPLLLQCGPKGHTAQHSSLRTWFFCWPDDFDPDWTIILWTTFSLLAYFVDVGLDITEAWRLADNGDHVWAALIMAFIFLPHVVSILYFMIILNRPWKEVYPAGMVYWSWKTIWGYWTLPAKEKVTSSHDAVIYMQHLRNFQKFNRERVQSSDLDLYFGAIPQLVLQSYISAQTALDSYVYEISTSSWLSLCSSAIFLLRYEPSARHGRKGMIVGMESVVEPAVYEFWASNFFDFMFIVPRAVTLGCFLTARRSYFPPLLFFPVHLIIAFVWFWLSAPREDAFQYMNSVSARDFRGTRRGRKDVMDHLQAAVASLVYPPTHKSWPKDFLSWKERFRAVLTEQFCVVTVFQLLETVMLLTVWLILSNNRVPVVAISLSVLFWVTARVVFHVLYYTVVLFPLYTYEWERCVRRRGLIAKMEIIRMAEGIGGYFCTSLGPRLKKVHDLMRLTSSREGLKEELEWLANRYLTDSVGIASNRRGRTQKHRLMSMGLEEKDVMRSTRQLALQSMAETEGASTIPAELVQEWEEMTKRNAVVAAFWSEVLLAALNHHFLPAKLHQADRDVSLSVYPKMFHNLVIRNNLHSKRKRDRRITFRSGGRRTSSTLTIDSVETTASGNLYHTSFLSESFGENLNFEYIESDQESGVSYV